MSQEQSSLEKIQRPPVATATKLLNVTLQKNKDLQAENARLRRLVIAAESKLSSRAAEFIVGDFGSVAADPESENPIAMTLLTYNLSVGDDVTETTITPEQAFAMGNALLQIAKLYGLEPIHSQAV